MIERDEDRVARERERERDRGEKEKQKEPREKREIDEEGEKEEDEDRKERDARGRIIEKSCLLLVGGPATCWLSTARPPASACRNCG